MNSAYNCASVAPCASKLAAGRIAFMETGYNNRIQSCSPEGNRRAHRRLNEYAARFIC